jgi:hypothetical protein
MLRSRDLGGNRFCSQAGYSEVLSDVLSFIMDNNSVLQGRVSVTKVLVNFRLLTITVRGRAVIDAVAMLMRFEGDWSDAVRPRTP